MVNSIIVKDLIAVYGPGVSLTEKYAKGPGFIDSTTRLDNAEQIDLDAIGIHKLPNYWKHGNFTWDSETQTLSPTESYLNEMLPKLKVEKHKLRVEQLEIAREGGFLFGDSPQHEVQSDVKSQLLIQGAVQLAQFSITAGTEDLFSLALGGGWRAKDEAIVASTPQEIIELAQGLAFHIAVCDSISQSKKIQIDEATTFEELDSIDVSSDYPIMPSKESVDSFVEEIGL